MMKKVFEITRSRKDILREIWSDGAFEIEFVSADKKQKLFIYRPTDFGKETARMPYGGMTSETVLASGEDLLTKKLLADGEPSYQKVESLLPKVEEGAYAFFGGAVSWSGIELDLTSGVLYSQVFENNNAPTSPLFTPTSEDEILGKQKPFVYQLDARYPVLFSVHTDGKDAMELMYFVEAGDPDRDPVVWIRTKRYAVNDPSVFTLRHQALSRSRVIFQHEIAEETFYTALADTVAYWLRFDISGASFHIPEKQLESIISGTQIACAVTFSGDHPHYGHRYYGKETHDHFPPNFLWTLEMCCVQNRLPWARRILDHLFIYSLTDEGRFVYRQGSDELFGASACEYAQLIWLLRRYAEPLKIKEEYLEQLLGMGDYLLSHLRPCEELGGKQLIYMCAEADSNTRVHAYLNNNLWCVRGLEALAAILDRFGYAKEKAAFFRQRAQELYSAVTEALSKGSTNDDRFGALPPFRFGYTAAPLTLSNCRDTFYPVSDEEYERYARRIDMRAQGSSVQEYTENCYANYRYYPEMLGTMLLPDAYAKGIVSLRENLGGEILCMTRFMGHLDDWPVLHYARFLLEKGYTDKYLTLLYAHACHHGRPELNTYYEQVTVSGKIMAEDCVPSLLTAPIMAAWMFAYEDVSGDQLSLLAAIPGAWYKKGFSAENIGLSFGNVSINASAKKIEIHFSKAPQKPFRLTLNLSQTLSPEKIGHGAEHILDYEENTLVLTQGLKDISIEIL